MQKDLNKRFSWRNLQCSSSGDRYFHTSVLYKEYMITYGGYSDKEEDTLGDIKVLNLKKRCYETFNLKGEIPPPRYRHSACLIDSNKILVFGGFHKNILSDPAIITIEDTTPLTLTYKSVKTTGGDNFVRCSHSADVYNNKMYLFGGRHQNNPVRSNNELWSLDLETWTWKICETTGEQPEARTTHISAIYNGKLYIFGGYSDSKGCKIEGCHVLSLDTMKWENLVPEGKRFKARYGALSAVYENRIYIVGGYYGPPKVSKEIICYDFDTNVLSKIPVQDQPLGVRFASLVLFRDSLVAWGGKNSIDKSVPDVQQIRIDITSEAELYEGPDDVFSKHFRSMLFSEQYSDIAFLIDGQKFPAHKIVLATRCKHFNNIFTSGMKEAHSDVIEVTDMKIHTFKALIGFIYKNEVELTEKIALELFEVADKYMQNELAGLCEEFLSKNLRFDNLVFMIEFADKFEAIFVKDAIIEFIIRNLEEIKSNQAKYKVPDSYLWEVISRVSKK